MPELTRFFGIIIRMFTEPTGPHHRPTSMRTTRMMLAIFAIDLIELMAGSLLQRQRRYVEAWAEIHQAELLAAWEHLQAGRPPGKIEPLR